MLAKKCKRCGAWYPGRRFWCVNMEGLDSAEDCTKYRLADADDIRDIKRIQREDEHNNAITDADFVDDRL